MIEDLAASGLKFVAVFTVVFGAFAVASHFYSKWQRYAGEREVREAENKANVMFVPHPALDDLLEDWVGLTKLSHWAASHGLKKGQAFWTDGLGSAFASMHGLKFVPFSRAAKLYMLKSGKGHVGSTGYFEFESSEEITLFLLSAKATQDKFKQAAKQSN